MILALYKDTFVEIELAKKLGIQESRRSSFLEMEKWSKRSGLKSKEELKMNIQADCVSNLTRKK